jgi:LCP family protein required for cell wall assembly
MTVIAVLGIFSGVAGATVWHRAKSSIDDTYKAAGINKQRDVAQVLKDGKPFSVLLLGTDTGELGRDYRGRTDSIMVMTVNPKKQAVTLMSIPRDTVISVVGFEDSFPQKMNAAYEDGETAATLKTVQTWLNIPIDFYALVNMRGLKEVVDEIGGVSVVSPLSFDNNPDMEDHVTPGNYYSFTKGSDEFGYSTSDSAPSIHATVDDTPAVRLQAIKDSGLFKMSTNMDGNAALAFSRMRYDDPLGDYGRTQRQRLVLEAIMHKAKSSPTSLVNEKFFKTVGSNAQTDLTFGDMMTIVQKYTKAANDIKTDHAQGTSIMIAGGSYEHVERGEQQRVTDVLRKALGLKAETTGPLYAGEVSDADVAALGLTSQTYEESQMSATTSSDTSGQ